jgi:hypothetical protein
MKFKEYLAPSKGVKIRTIPQHLCLISVDPLQQGIWTNKFSAKMPNRRST